MHLNTCNADLLGRSRFFITFVLLVFLFQLNILFKHLNPLSQGPVIISPCIFHSALLAGQACIVQIVFRNAVWTTCKATTCAQGIPIRNRDEAIIA
mmetsp:Transcript_45761/g.118271  ORF Transcript_45761/g.118271 Transcript_45761/m.118271 type:complete len:96 (+) Transcript_45761:1218-1505(+)